MKRIGFIALYLLGCLNVFAQNKHWAYNMDLPFYELQKQFNNYYLGKNLDKEKGIKPFKRIEHYWQTRLNPDGTYRSPVVLNQNYETWLQQSINSTTNSLDSGQWVKEGPEYSRPTDYLSLTGSGRVNVVKMDPNNSDIVYVGTPGGGLWKSTDSGNNWITLIDHFSRLGVSDLIIDPNNSDVLYLATGDDDGGTTVSIGMWKSLDGGLTWNPSGLSDVERISRIDMDPQNSSRLLAATRFGLYYTSNGGDTWTNVSVGSGITNVRFKDVRFGQNGSQSAFAVAHNGGFYKSYDKGLTWEEINTGLPPTIYYPRLDVALSDSNYIYMITSTPFSGYHGIFKSIDAGESFIQTHGIADGDLYTGVYQGYYDLDIAINQSNKEEIIMGAYDTRKSYDGGYTWEDINFSQLSPFNADFRHPDIHYLEWFGDTILYATDGGYFITYDEGVTTSERTKNLQIAEIHDFSVYNSDPGFLTVGLQDNGSVYFDGEWKNFMSGDGIYSAFHHEDSSITINSMQRGIFGLNEHDGTSVRNISKPYYNIPASWWTPAEWDETTEKMIVGYNKLYEYDGYSAWQTVSNFAFGYYLSALKLYQNKRQTMLAHDGADILLYSSTAGQTWDTIYTIQAFDTNGVLQDAITDIEFDDSDSLHILIAKKDTVVETFDGGQTWMNITQNLPAVHFNDIEYDHTSSDHSMYLASDVGIHYKNDNLGEWIPFSNGLPRVNVKDIELQPAFNAIRIGTYGKGLYFSNMYNTALFVNDVQAFDVGLGSDTICSAGDYAIEAVFRNRGFDTLYSFDYTISIDGFEIVSDTWNGVLEPFKKSSIIYPPMYFAQGNSTITFTVSNPNGVPDAESSNNSNTRLIYVENDNNEYTVNLFLELSRFTDGVSWDLYLNDSTLIDSSEIYSDIDNLNERIQNRYCLSANCYTFTLSTTGVHNGISDPAYITGPNQTEYVSIEPLFYGTDTFDFCVPQITDPPIVSFTESDTAICFHNTVQFTDLSLNTPTIWQWYFEGGTPQISYDQNPLVTYEESGDYAVQLIVSNALGSDTISLIEYISVTGFGWETFENNYNCSDSITISHELMLSDYTVEWYDVNGVMIGNDSTLTLYEDAEISYTITDNTTGCIASADMTILIPDAIMAEFTSSASILYLNQSGMVSFTNTSTTGMEYLWDFGDGNTSTDVNPNHEYTTEGVYNVILTISDSLCTESYSQEIIVTNNIHVLELEHKDFVVYPNPNSGQFFLQKRPNLDDVSFKIHDVLGKLVLEQKMINDLTEVDMTRFKAGNYTISMYSGFKKLHTEKLILIN